MMRSLAAICLATFYIATSAASAASDNRTMVALDWQGARLEGTMLGRSPNGWQLLGRDGRLWSLPAEQSRTARTLTAPFRGYSAMEVRRQLIEELGDAFEVKPTGHYVVAFPRGGKDNWSPRFEDLYRHFLHYFSVRGFRPREPEFPLVAIVWRNQQEFLRYARRERANVGNNILGYYSQTTNRITLYDVGAGSDSSQSWAQNADTIIHEATHQTAYNTGVHRRFAATPRWVVEGLGTMFEAPGVWKAEDNRRAEDRINRGRLAEFRRFLPQRRAGLLAEMIASDRLFETDMSVAYANAWALSFFLAETQHRRYTDYLQRMARRPPFQGYSANERTADFTAVFGSNLALVETHFLRYLAELK